jgi:hypothetical protein
VWLTRGITKKWTILPVANPTPIFQANDYCIIRDGNLIHGYASHTGRVDTITTSGSADRGRGPSCSSWVTLVADGTQAWGLRRLPRPMGTALLSRSRDPTMVSNRLIGLLRDGSTAYGLSAHYGTFVPVAADPSAVLALVGEAGSRHGATARVVLRAFSAQQNTWGVQAVPGTATMLQQNEVRAGLGGNQAWALSRG